MVGGSAFLGDDDGRLFALARDDGGVLWEYRHALHHDDGRPARSSVAGLPAVSDDLVFAEAGGQVFAHDRRTGDLRWHVPEIGARHPVVAGGLLIVVHGLDEAAAYDAVTGDRRWVTEPADDLGFGFLSTFAAVAGDRVFLTEGFEGNHTHGGLHAFDLTTGAVTWGRHEEQVACGHPRCEGNDLTLAPYRPVYARGLVWAVRNRYCDADGDTGMELVGFDPADGAERVVLAEPGDVFFAAPVFGPDLVYCASGPRLHALDPASGEPVWSHTFDARVVGSPLHAGHIVHVALEGGRLHGLDARTGDPRWGLTLDEPTAWSADPDSEYEEVAAPITLADGVLYAATRTAVVALA